MADDEVVIVGAGLAGCLLACLLGRRGVQVTVFERREDPRVAEPERGRSINLAVSARGLAAMEQVGLADQMLGRALPMHGRMIHAGDGSQSLRPYSAGGKHAINSISRAELNVSLLDVAAKTAGVSFRFGHRLADLDLNTATLSFDTDQGPRTQTATVILASDGAFSTARKAVTFRPGFTFSQDYLDHGYKELTIPARNGDFAIDPDALHIWPRGGSMMIALPNLDRSFTCTLFWSGEQFAALTTAEEIVGHFRAVYPDVVDLVPNLVEDYQRNPIGSLATIRCWPWVHRGEAATLALVGDAAHAIVPFFGQGANSAMEDTIEIDACLAECDGDWGPALDAYERRRKANSDAIAEMALDNFVEMRDRVNSKVFQYKTHAQHWLERRLPGRYVSRYELVSFTTIPYAQIPELMRRQNRTTALAGTTAGVLLLAALRRLVRRGAA